MSEKYSAKDLQKFLVKEKVSTIEQLKRILGTRVRMTVLRKLSELGYQTSYSHNAKFYTLKQLVASKGLVLCLWDIIGNRPGNH